MGGQQATSTFAGSSQVSWCSQTESHFQALSPPLPPQEAHALALWWGSPVGMVVRSSLFVCGMEPVPSAVKARIPNYWTNGECPQQRLCSSGLLALYSCWVWCCLYLTCWFFAHQEILRIRVQRCLLVSGMWDCSCWFLVLNSLSLEIICHPNSKGGF